MSAVPAWKRLGLKLKGADSDGSPAVTAPQPATTTTSGPLSGRFAHNQQRPSFNPDGQYGTPAFNKRKQLPSGSYPAPDIKRPRWDDPDFTPSKKSVSFSQDTKKAVPKKPKPTKKKKKASKPQSKSQPHDITPSLEYLRTWLKARDAWKFNKNHQSLLLKYMFKPEALPAADIDAFYLYINDIKGGSRTRLVEQAEEVRKKDREAGPKGFPVGSKGAEEKQGQYEEMLAGLLKKEEEAKGSGSSNGAHKRSFDEVEFTLRTVDGDIQQRLVKRMRAELVIKTLKSSGSGDDTAAAAASTTNGTSSRVKVPVPNGTNAKGIGIEGTKKKTKRRKKLRTADTDSSSSESSSDSDSDSGSDESDADIDNASDSSSSSSASDSDEEPEVADGRSDAELSSSSSSSSESESEDDSSAGAAVAENDDTEDDDTGSDADSESAEGEQ